MRDKNYIEQINHLLLLLSKEEQEALWKALRKQILLAKAERLNRSVKPNQITMKTIVEQVQKARKKRYERQ